MLSIMWIEEVEKADLEREKKMNKADKQRPKGTYSYGKWAGVENKEA